MVFRDPYAPDQKRFECPDCSYRKTADSHKPTCPHCGGDMRNIAVPRE